ncbi:MAG: hypothetical protein K0U47_01765 [Epsilonproteobacteria bacterium]|nr:hypothetical protein [Campylobacterota bacterium]
MPYKLSMLISVLVTTMTFSGCGGDSGSDNNVTSSSVDLPDGKTLIFYDAKSSKQYSYDTETERYTQMNVAEKNYDMEGKSGNIFTWFDPTNGTAIDQKIIMFKDTYDYSVDGNVTYDDFHYLGHFHTEDDAQVFAAHSASEFDPDNNASVKKLAALKRLSSALNERELQKEKILEVLPADKVLCNYYQIEHTEVEEEEEALPYIALTTNGQIYIYSENNETLSQIQAPIQLEGVTECKEDESAIAHYSEEGVLVFSAQTQKLYLVDSHGDDFHQHSTFTISRFLPEDFTPTQMAGIGEGEHDHDEDGYEE